MGAFFDNCAFLQLRLIYSYCNMLYWGFFQPLPTSRTVLYIGNILKILKYVENSEAIKVFFEKNAQKSFHKNVSFYFLQFVIFCDLEWLPYLDLSLERPQVMSNLFVMLWKSLTSRLDGTIDLRGMNIQ